jgi:hypothetical protein
MNESRLDQIELELAQLRREFASLVKHLKLVIHPGYIARGIVYQEPEIREACKECGR